MPTIRRFLRLSFVALLLMGAACASGGGAAGSSPPNRSIITESEIPSTGTESLYDLIQRLRPEFLRVRPNQTYTASASASAPPPALVVNGQRYGEFSDLRSMAANSVTMVRYYTIEQSKVKFGTQYSGGVIELVLRTL